MQHGQCSLVSSDKRSKYDSSSDDDTSDDSSTSSHFTSVELNGHNEANSSGNESESETG